MFLSDEGPTFKTSDFTFYIGSTATLLYFDFYLNTAYATHYILCFSNEGPTLKTLHFAFYISGLCLYYTLSQWRSQPYSITRASRHDAKT